MTFSMKSKYDGFCTDCKQRIHKGDDITKNEETGKWVHVKHPVAPIPAHNKSIVSALQQASQNNPIAVDLSGNPLPILVEVEEDRIIVTDWTPSVYQQNIFDFIAEGTGNGVVEAVAGSGKTSTIVRALSIVPKDSKVAFLAFNKHIARTLKDKLRAMGIENVHASTIHSLGLQIIRKHNDFKDIQNDILEEYMDEYWSTAKKDCPDQKTRKERFAKRALMRRLISLSMAVLLDYKSTFALSELMDHYGIEEDEYTPEVFSRLPALMERCKDIEHVSFDQMIWLPLILPELRNHFEQFDYLFVDEAQDLNNSQIQFILKSIRKGGRIVVVGDRKQSLYGFRGADTDAIPNLIRDLNAKVLPLSISYRCPKVLVQMAKRIVPQIEASDTAIEGLFAYVEFKDFLTNVEPGDMVLCRTNAPLIGPAFECIRQGKKAIIRGQDIGKSLIIFIERFNADDLSQLDILMGEYTSKEVQRLLDKGKELQADMAIDKLNTIRTVSNQCITVPDLINKIAILFSDSNTGVVFSSVHRAKGLEAERVYVLKPELMPHPKAKQPWELIQEDNTLYVAITRSKDKLFYVKGEIE